MSAANALAKITQAIELLEEAELELDELGFSLIVNGLDEALETLGSLDDPELIMRDDSVGRTPWTALPGSLSF